MISQLFLMPLLNLFGGQVNDYSESKRKRGGGSKGSSRASDRH